MNNQLFNKSGLTLIEMIVAISISSLIVIFLARLFSVSLSSHDLQEQLADMNQNAKYTIKELSDVLMQAGADLQLSETDTLDSDTIVLPDDNLSSCTGFKIKINPRGGMFIIPQRITMSVCSIQVDNASNFRYADKMARISSVASSPLKIYSLVRYDSVSNYVVFNPADTFSRNDMICSFVTDHYYLRGSNLCLNNDTNVIAENIDSLAITFLDINGTPTSSWGTMRSVQLCVRTKTSQPDNRYKGYPDHRRRITLTNEFRLRNKVESSTR